MTFLFRTTKLKKKNENAKEKKKILINRILGISCDGQCGDADTNPFDGEQWEAAGFGSGTGGDDIVDEQQVFAFQLFGLCDGENAMHIV